MSRLSLRVKIVIAVVAPLVLLGLVATIDANAKLYQSQSEHLAQHGILLARDLAVQSADLVSNNDLPALYRLLWNAKRSNLDVSYIVVLDPQGRVLARTIPETVPPEVLAANPLRPGQDYSVESVVTDQGIARDVAAPISGGRLGVVRVGMSEGGLREFLMREIQYRWLVGAVLVAVAATVGFSLALSVVRPLSRLVEVTRSLGAGDLSRRADIRTHDEIEELARAFNKMADELAALYQEVRAFATLEERSRIAREMHDGLTQSVAALGMKIEATHSYLSTGRLEEARAEMDRARALVNDVYQEARASIRVLKISPLLRETGLGEALRRYVADFARDTNISAEVEMVEEKAGLGPTADSELFRIVQEALTNVRRHARASQVRVQARRSDGALEVSVQDNGRGFDPALVGRDGRQFGLLTMRERAEGLGGTFEVQSAPGKGTRVAVRVPLRKEKIP